MGAEEAHYPIWDMEYRILVGGSRHGIGALVLWSIVNMRIFRRFPMIQEKGGNIEYAFQALHRLMLEIEQSTKHTEMQSRHLILFRFFPLITCAHQYRLRKRFFLP